MFGILFGQYFNVFSAGKTNANILFIGHIVMDEDLERTVLVVNLGVIPPMETVHILVSTSSELSTLPSGGICVSSPPVCTPRVQRTINEEQGLSPNFSRT